MSVFGVLLVVACVTSCTMGEMFTAMAELQAALYAEHDVAGAIKMYIKSEEARLNKLKRTAEELESHSSYALENPDRNIANPVDAFLFVKKFTLDWDRNVATLFEKNRTQQELLNRIESYRQALPTDEDLLGAVSALMRLQDTYKLDTARLAQGDINGIHSAELSADACFEIGRVNYVHEDYVHAETWMKQALRSLPGNPLSVSGFRAEILDYLSFTVYKVD
ncbi:prolyl 4-hydroxylase subunit alpha-1-like [Gigantopelta aegis]|uniref:prolyl 4-hydroxylase subunit alpha-1-like n=1 Tax=Gigantopelta aegis TaxID=1735272 RepID=UPI001B88ABF2|nr:prolyl 4-hydroxylase subunit alpha-1-like [Gigantopelta aegis]